MIADRWSPSPDIVYLPSTVGVLTIADGMDLQGIHSFFGETDAVVTDSKAQFAGYSLEHLDVAFTTLCEAMKRGKDTHSGLPIQAANISPCAFGPGDFLHA
jgi:hypothetical protein